MISILQRVDYKLRWALASLLYRFRIVKYPYWILVNLCYSVKIKSVYNIPVIINNYNRLSMPLQLLAFLEKCGFKNIIILDNNSTYPPLLDYYKTCKHKVIRNNQNLGHLALWKAGLYHQYKWDYFVYTDSDVVPIDECPLNFISKFKEKLSKYTELDKIGFGIKIDDLPSYFTLKDSVVKYEQAYWSKEVEPGLYDAKLDTTFALYKPLSNMKFDEVYTLKSFRFGHPYLIKHLPWYIDASNLTDEDANYINTSNISSSFSQQLKGLRTIY